MSIKTDHVVARTPKAQRRTVHAERAETAILPDLPAHWRGNIVLEVRGGGGRSPRRLMMSRAAARTLGRQLLAFAEEEPE